MCFALHSRKLLFANQVVDESYTTAQRLAHLPGKQKVPGSNPGGAAWHVFQLGLQSAFSAV